MPRKNPVQKMYRETHPACKWIGKWRRREKRATQDLHDHMQSCDK